MEDDLESAEDERSVELTAIAAIFPELIVDLLHPFSASLSLPVSPSKAIAVFSPPSAGGAPPDGLLTPPSSDGTSDVFSANQAAKDRQPVQEVHRLSHLPSLNLRISLPDGYPSKTSPRFDILTEVAWLPESKLQELTKAGYTLWEDMGKDQVVFSYIDYLQQEADNCFGLVQAEGDYLKVPRDLIINLLDFDEKAKRARFDKETFECGVCLGKDVYVAFVR